MLYLSGKLVQKGLFARHIPLDALNILPGKPIMCTRSRQICCCTAKHGSLGCLYYGDVFIALQGIFENVVSPGALPDLKTEVWSKTIN